MIPTNAEILGNALMDLLTRVVAFQQSRFPGQSLESKLKHLAKEAGELSECGGTDLHEWADVLLLFLGSADLKGLTLFDLILAGNCKMDINDSREWLPADSDGCFHHKKP
jgi:hypothetical protein